MWRPEPAGQPGCSHHVAAVTGVDIGSGVIEAAKALAASCDAQRRENLRRDFIAFHEHYRGDLGVAMPRDYLLTIGLRK
jgi:hypothetical protein